jgi:hypothetical protein
MGLQSRRSCRRHVQTPTIIFSGRVGLMSVDALAAEANVSGVSDGDFETPLALYFRSDIGDEYICEMQFVVSMSGSTTPMRAIGRSAPAVSTGTPVGPLGAPSRRVRADLGPARLLPVHDAVRRLSAQWRDGRARPVGRRQARTDDHLHVVSRPLGEASQLARGRYASFAPVGTRCFARWSWPSRGVGITWISRGFGRSASMKSTGSTARTF